MIESGFVRGEERWQAVESTGRSVSLNYNAVVQRVAVSAPGRGKVYFLAPGWYCLGWLWLIIIKKSQVVGFTESNC